MSVIYASKFFELQIRFAQKIKQLADQTIFDVVVDYTVLRFLLQLYVVPKGEAEPLWHELLQRIEEDEQPTEWVYALYQERLNMVLEWEKQRVKKPFGCFNYGYPFRNASTVRLHFQNRPELAEGSLLSHSEIEVRKAELRQMFATIKREHPDAQRVVGGSWMYHLEAYRRLFPPAYIATAKSGGYETGYFALWGQFIYRDGQVRESMASQFLDCLGGNHTLETAVSCFPYDVLRLECPIEIFYHFYAV